MHIWSVYCFDKGILGLINIFVYRFSKINMLHLSIETFQLFRL